MMPNRLGQMVCVCLLALLCRGVVCAKEHTGDDNSSPVFMPSENLSAYIVIDISNSKTIGTHVLKWTIKQTGVKKYVSDVAKLATKLRVALYPSKSSSTPEWLCIVDLKNDDTKIDIPLGEGGGVSIQVGSARDALTVKYFILDMALTKLLQREGTIKTHKLKKGKLITVNGKTKPNHIAAAIRVGHFVVLGSSEKVVRSLLKTKQSSPVASRLANKGETVAWLSCSSSILHPRIKKLGYDSLALLDEMLLHIHFLKDSEFAADIFLGLKTDAEDVKKKLFYTELDGVVFLANIMKLTSPIAKSLTITRGQKNTDPDIRISHSDINKLLSTIFNPTSLIKTTEQIINPVRNKSKETSK